jgi:hypothetical protein
MEALEMTKLAATLIAAVGLFIAGLLTGAWIERIPEAKAPEPHAAQLRQADASVILERNPTRPAPAPPVIPKGAKVTRETVLQIQHTPKAGEPLAPVETVELTQIETKDGGTRVIASTPDGQVIGGGDWTGPPPPALKLPRWSAGPVRAWTRTGAAWGASLSYWRGPVGLTVTAFPGQIQAGASIRW